MYVVLSLRVIGYSNKKQICILYMAAYYFCFYIKDILLYTYLHATYIFT